MKLLKVILPLTSIITFSNGAEAINQTQNKERTNHLVVQKNKMMQSPPLLEITALLLDGYKVEIRIACETYVLDMTSKKRNWDRYEIYSNGKVTRSYSFKGEGYIQLMPIVTKNGKGVRAVQKLKGPLPDTSIGEIVSVWFFRNNEWILKDIELNSSYKVTDYFINLK